MIRYNICQGDEFVPSFVIESFDLRSEAENRLEELEKESTEYDAYTCFWIEESFDD